MPKFPTFPTLYDECKTISITDLKRWEYLKPNQWKSGILTWSRNGNKTGSISIAVHTYSETPVVELEYNYNDEPRKYKIDLVSIPSNLGKGEIWYFVCPHTYKLCRKLYSISGYFYHRTAFRGIMYESQIQSKKYRNLDKTLGAYFRLDDLYQQLYKKHFKKTYAGKPTKRYLKLMKQITQAEGIPYGKIERLMMS